MLSQRLIAPDEEQPLGHRGGMREVRTVVTTEVRKGMTKGVTIG